MIANYGYKDGSGEWFISIDTDKCSACAEKNCVRTCKGAILEVVFDDYDDEVVAVGESHRKKIKYSCSPCRPVDEKLPCQQGCPHNAITRSW